MLNTHKHGFRVVGRSPATEKGTIAFGEVGDLAKLANVIKMKLDTKDVAADSVKFLFEVELYECAVFIVFVGDDVNVSGTFFYDTQGLWFDKNIDNARAMNPQELYAATIQSVNAIKADMIKAATIMSNGLTIGKIKWCVRSHRLDNVYMTLSPIDVDLANVGVRILIRPHNDDVVLADDIDPTTQYTRLIKIEDAETESLLDVLNKIKSKSVAAKIKQKRQSVESKMERYIAFLNAMKEAGL
jgi:hypothetical protein